MYAVRVGVPSFDVSGKPVHDGRLFQLHARAWECVFKHAWAQRGQRMRGMGVRQCVCRVGDAPRVPMTCDGGALSCTRNRHPGNRLPPLPLTCDPASQRPGVGAVLLVGAAVGLAAGVRVGRGMLLQ